MQHNYAVLIAYICQHMSRRVILLNSGLLRNTLRSSSWGHTSSYSKKAILASLKCVSSVSSSRIVLEVQKYSELTTRSLSSTTNDGDKKDIGIGTDELKTAEPANVSNYNPQDDAFFTQDVAYGSKMNKGLGNPERPFYDPPQVAQEVEVVEQEEELNPPSDCCRSGCPNCVWIDYVEKLSKRYADPLMNREKVLKELDGMEDQNIKAFLMMELRSRGLI